MSYVVQLWEMPPDHPPLGTIADAVRMLAQLEGQPPAQNPRFIELARRLNSHLPADPVEDEGDGPDGLWTDFPLSGQTTRAVFVLGIHTEFLAEALPVAINEARELGLMLLDGQAGQAWCPDGTVLDIAGRAMASASPVVAEPDPFPNRAQILAFVHEHLDALMTQQGFKWVKGQSAYIRKKPCKAAVSIEVNCRLVPEVKVHASFCCFGYEQLADMRLYYEPHAEGWGWLHMATKGALMIDLHNLRARHPESIPALPQRSATATDNLGCYWTFLESRADLEAMMRALKPLLTCGVLPLIEDCKNWQDIYQLANAQDPEGSVVIFEGRDRQSYSTPYLDRSVLAWNAPRDKLLIAHLARSRDFDELADRLVSPLIVHNGELSWTLAPLRSPDNCLQFDDVPETLRHLEELPDDALIAGPAEVRGIVQQRVAALMVEHGFAWVEEKRAFVKAQAAFDLIIGLHCERWKAPFKFRLSVHAWNSPEFKALKAKANAAWPKDLQVASIDNPLMPSGLRASLAEFARFTELALPPLPEDPVFRFTLTTLGDVRQCVETLEAHLRHAMLPVLAECQDWSGVDKYCNHGFLPDCPFGRGAYFEVPRQLHTPTLPGWMVDSVDKLIVAILAGRTDVADLARTLKEVGREVKPAVLQVLGIAP